MYQNDMSVLANGLIYLGRLKRESKLALSKEIES